MNQIIFKENDWQRLTEYLAKRKDLESGAYAVYKVSKSPQNLKLLINDLIIPEDSDYFARGPAIVAFKPGFSERAFRQCEVSKGHLLDIHTHPWSTRVSFSHIDDREALQTKIPYLKKYLPQIMIAFMVFGISQEIAKARFWEPGSGQPTYIGRIIII